ncbi:E3 ubiquitin-protein ligase TRIM36-like isoform X2 [Ptychodera flava]|uniref:E3 ubiquitin-protein ligase TRIM36-like isoform X2 n=1 Tax=Ptychodera flava TaxID=63121 RepID=UPI003969D41F
MDSFERELICPVCDDYFTSPLVLPCQHNLCHKCAIKMVLSPRVPDEDLSVSSDTSGLGSTLSRSSSASRPLTSVDLRDTGDTEDVVDSVRSLSVMSAKSQKFDLSKIKLRRRSSSPPPSPVKPYSLSPRSKAMDEMEKGEHNISQVTVIRRNSQEKVSQSSQKRWSFGGMPSRDRRPSTPPLGSTRHISLDYGSPSIGDKVKVSPRRNSVLTIAITMEGKTSPRRESISPSQIYCPYCKKHVPLGEAGINKLFRNFTLESIITRFKRSARLSTMLRCQHCKSKPAAEATRTCSNCSDNFCNDCYKDSHPWGTPRAQHEYTAVGNHRPKAIMCTEHEDEKIGWYCDVCQRPTCRVCKLTGVHAGHKMYAIAATYARLKAKLTKQVELLEERREAMRDAVVGFQNSVDEIENNATKIEEMVIYDIEELKSRLEEKKQELIDKLQQAKVEKLERPLERIQCLNEILADTVIVEYAKEVLKEEEQTCFVQSAIPLAGRLSKLLESCKRKEKTTEVDVNIDCALDTTFEKDVINSLDFLEVFPTELIMTSHERSDESNQDMSAGEDIFLKNVIRLNGSLEET